MKKMTKEELIEYFIEQLGDNEILGQVISIEQIRKKLTNIIKDVTYNNGVRGNCGEWIADESGRGIVNLDKDRIPINLEKEIIVHELLHALSTKILTLKSEDYLKEVKEKCGLQINKIYYHGNDKERYGTGTNIGINEGMTDALAEAITGTNSSGYNNAKDIYKIVSIVIGKDTMLRKYFSEKISEGESSLDIFLEELKEKYGEILGNEINDDLRKVLSLSDQLVILDKNDDIHGLSEKGRFIQSKTKDEIYDALENMINRVIENEADIMTKINNILIPLFNTSLGKKFSESILGQLIDCKELELDEKLTVLRYVKQEKLSYIPEIILENILSNDMISFEEKIDYYFQLSNEKEEKWNKIYNWYVESGKISEGVFPKRNAFNRIVRSKYTKSIRTLLNNTKYRKIGDYYEIIGEHELFDTAGNIVAKDRSDYEPSEETGIDESFTHKLERNFQNIDIDELQQQLKEKYIQLAKHMSQQGIKKYEYGMEISIEGNIIRMVYYCDNPKVQSNGSLKDEFFSIDENGSLVYLNPRSRKKIYR